MRLRLVIVAAALAVAGGAAGTASAEAGAAGFAGSYFASAVADGVRLTFIAPSASLSDTAADVGGPSAQATLDSLGTSRAFGSFPYSGRDGRHQHRAWSGRFPELPLPTIRSTPTRTTPS